MRSKARLKQDEGAVFVEMLIAYLPVMFFFMATWQLAELAAAHLVVQHAAAMTARAAAVVIPDDPFYYDGTATDAYTGSRKDDVELAAKMILASAPQISNDPQITVTGASGNGPMKATVAANFHCLAGWVSLVCGAGGVRTITVSAESAYHGAKYQF